MSQSFSANSPSTGISLRITSNLFSVTAGIGGGKVERLKLDDNSSSKPVVAAVSDRRCEGTFDAQRAPLQYYRPKLRSRRQSSGSTVVTLVAASLGQGDPSFRFCCSGQAVTHPLRTTDAKTWFQRPAARRFNASLTSSSAVFPAPSFSCRSRTALWPSTCL